jgi:lysophospholipase L1-like esterase
MLSHRNLARNSMAVVLIFILSACGGGGSDSPPPAPSTTTMDADPITNDNAVLNADVNPNGLGTNAWFEYGADNALSTFTMTTDQGIGSGTVPQSIHSTVTGLSAGTIYYYRVVATNPAGTSKGTIESFTAASLPPTVSTSAAGPVSNDNAVLNGDVNPKGLATNAWFEWGTDPTLDIRTITSIQDVGAGPASVSIQTTSLTVTPGTTYYFRIAAQNTAGTSRGTIENFKASQIPSATTNGATSVTSNSATVNGDVNPAGLQTIYWFVWGTDPSLTLPSSTHETPVQGMAAGTFTAQPVSAPLSGLGAETTYYFRTVASNADGEFQGAIKAFLTSVSPTVNTTAATSITTTGAVLNGNVNPNGYATDAWFEYGTDPALSSSASTTSNAMGSGVTALPTSASISGLTPFRTYYYRVAAVNSGGTQKGVIRSFPTGEYYVAVGDSITGGSQDDIPADGIGFEPILDTLLTAAKGYPHTVDKVGVSGDTSADGAASIGGTLGTHSNAKYYLILYGTNDADTSRGVGYPVPKTTYKANMQAIITAVKNDGKIPYLAKVPYTTDPLRSDAAIRGYNAAIDELRGSNGIAVVAPDFYAWFQSHQIELSDGVHPDGTGYQSMASKWFEVLP